MSSDPTRRRFLLGGGTVAALALAGCVGDDTNSGDNSTDNTDETMDNSSMEDDDDSMEDEGSMDDGTMESVTMTVRIENVAPTDFYPSDASTGGQIWITPGAYAVHTGTNPIYTEGESATIGLEALAEAGPPTGFEGEPGLVDELTEMANMGMDNEMEGDDSMDDDSTDDDSMDGSMEESAVLHAGAYTPENTVADPNDPMGSVPGAPPIAPGGAFEFEIEAEPGQRLSFASMFVPSNDLFFSPSPEGIALWPADGEPVAGDVTDAIGLYDAGTEPNGEPGFDPDQAPAQNSPDQGDDEGGVVRPLREVADGFEYPAVEDAIQVTVAPQ
ncbi:hypothetical protein GRX03_08800 [Halovenus sp. WSH3]|uniref:Spondin domain-containing protein n=1 Tax=Halovenus carboxidivorans TaxID=2692199 RepID=A0A6B0TES0_9EURY|nr:spondin domain-containing protein [Halovenus carboxidivorans]MXR51699.1 hypothetical protein [Halovenus carboxidivorans]